MMNLVRVVLFVLCIPSAGALLLKAYGLISMREAFLWIGIPSGLLLIGSWRLARRQRSDGWQRIGEALALGFAAGIVATAAYDLARLPFYLGGARPYVPIFVYGLWITDGSAATAWTNLMGWSYHFSNGITFAIMYSLFMRGAAVFWAIVWALLLETIALVAPSGPMFGVTGKPIPMLIAYLGHVAYGIPLGLAVKHWRRSCELLGRIPHLLRPVPVAAMAVVLAATALPAQVVHPRDDRRQLTIDGKRLRPGYLRVDRGTRVVMHNPGERARRVQVGTRERVQFDGGESREIEFSRPGVVRVYIETEGRAPATFVVVEPAEQFDRN